MTQGKTFIIVLVTLVIGFGAGFTLRPIIAPAEPRGTQYFAANVDEARQIVAQCAEGSVRGDECANAEQAVTKAEGRERFKKFMGN